MTQDAIPADEHMAGTLLKAFDDPEVWAAYARQLPKENCREVEKYTRSFNYPEESRIKGKEDLPILGIKTFFCSNVCAAWRRDKYLELGGFVKRTIFNEDMIYAGTIVKKGGKIAYCCRCAWWCILIITVPWNSSTGILIWRYPRPCIRRFLAVFGQNLRESVL